MTPTYSRTQDRRQPRTSRIAADHMAIGAPLPRNLNRESVFCAKEVEDGRRADEFVFVMPDGRPYTQEYLSFCGRFAFEAREVFAVKRR